MNLFEKISSVRVPVKHLEKSADWYTSQLGMTVIQKNEDIAKLKVFGGETVLVLERTDPFRPMEYLHSGGMLTHFNFNTLDAELALLMMKDRGIKVTEIHDTPVLKWFGFRDIDGNMLSVCYEKENSVFYQPITGSSLSLFERVEAVFILVRNLVEMMEWYLSLPGVELICESNLRVGNGETIITLIQVDDFTPQENKYFEFSTADLRRSHQVLKQLGVQVSGIHDDDQNPSCTIRDPEGNLFGLRCMNVKAPVKVL